MEQRLIDAARDGDLSTVKCLVEQTCYTSHDEALYHASRNGHLEIVKYLVEHGADINSEPYNPLIYASANGHTDVVKYLVEHGADVHVVNDYVIRETARYGHLEIVKYLMTRIDYPYIVKMDALLFSAAYCRRETVHFILDAVMKYKHRTDLTFVCSISMNNFRYCKLHIKKDIIITLTGYTSAITSIISKLLVRNNSLPPDMQNRLAAIPAVYKIIKPDNPSNSARKLHRLYK